MVWFISALPFLPYSAVLDTFESGIRNPYGNAEDRRLWLFYGHDHESHDRGMLTTATPPWDHPSILEATVSQGGLYLYFNPTDDSTGVVHNASEFLQRGRWQTDTYHRLSFWMQPPFGVPIRDDGGFNYHIGTFHRLSSEKRAQESTVDGVEGHYYYYLSLPDHPPNLWYRIEVDLLHPHHRRGEQTREWGLVPTPFAGTSQAEPHLNFADTLTKFYIETKQTGHDGTVLPYAEYPATFLFDDFRFERAHPYDNLQGVYTVAGGYDVGREILVLSWSRSRTTRADHEVRWSRWPIHWIGWDRAHPLTVAQGSEEGVYNAMQVVCPFRWPGFARSVYFGIRPYGGSHYRQFRLPYRESWE